MLLFGIVAYASVYVILNGVQQLALAYITANTTAYPFLNAQKMVISSGTTGASAPTYRVSISYDMSGSLIYNFIRFLPLPPPQVVRSAAIQRGGY